MLSLLTRLTQIKQNLLYSGRARKTRNKKQQNNNKNATKSILQCLFSAITQHSVTIRQKNKLGFNA